MVFQQLQAKKIESLQSIPEANFREAFAKFSLASAPLNAEGPAVDPSTVMRRIDLAQVLCEVVGRQPEPEEIDAFLTFFDTETSGLIDIDEYCKSIEALKKRSAAPSSAAAYISKKSMQEDRTKHRRLENNPQNVLNKPATTAQEVGWEAQKPISQSTTGFITLHPDMGNAFHGKKSSDVTGGEGRSITDWYL
ncbi:hypothetical protein CYMTET_52654 [Cymbomonas tetramitiformis]|uniref:EF-hand domain-containing protein n=1 Tax=Cymbomonas tetramitiformis TaxID=36881 RepID=A0AAE0BJQ3_9CHLO|nr:hypothetical protein CYMTET_52654 [Cymbomonas tetramitiformis]